MEKEQAEGRASGAGRFDLPQKELEAYPDVFADIINALVYGGEQIVMPGKLRPAETETRYRDWNRRLRNQFEDIGKYETGEDGKAEILYLLANQTAVDNRMLLRKCGYVGGCYRGQYNGQIADICPVMELVLYWGRKRWRAPRTMRGFFRKKKLRRCAWNYIDDEKLHVFEMRHLPQEVIRRFRGDMRVLLEYLSDESEAEKGTQEIRHPAALLEMMGELSGDLRYGQLIECLDRDGGPEQTGEGGKWTMCRLMDKYWEGGRQEGRKEGRKEGRREGGQEGLKALVVTCQELGVSFEDTVARVKKLLTLEEEEIEKGMAMYWQQDCQTGLRVL